MKLNCECVRDVLLKLEEVLTCEEDQGILQFNTIHAKQICDEFSNKYTFEEVYYTLYNLEQAGYIKAYVGWLEDPKAIFAFIIEDITFSGHEFTDNVRPKKVWDKVREVTSHIGTNELKIINVVAGQVLASMAKSYMHLP